MMNFSGMIKGYHSSMRICIINLIVLVLAMLGRLSTIYHRRHSLLMFGNIVCSCHGDCVRYVLFGYVATHCCQDQGSVVGVGMPMSDCFWVYMQNFGQTNLPPPPNTAGGVFSPILGHALST